MDEALQFAIESGMIDLSYVQEQYEMNKRIELLSQQKWAISQGKDGYWRTYLPDKLKGRKMIKKKSKKDVEDEVISYWKSELENPTIREVFCEWNDRRLALDKISASTHLRNIQVFDRHYKVFGNNRIKDTVPEEIGEFLEEQIPLYKLTSRAFSNLKSITKGMLKRAKKRKLISFNVEELFQELDTSESDFKKVVKRNYEEVFSEEETDIIITYLIEHPDRQNLGILVMFVTGIRVGELAALKKEDISPKCFDVCRTETKFLKDKKYVYEVKDSPKTDAGVRSVIIPAGYGWLAEKILEINPDDGYVFVNKKGERMTSNCFRQRLKRVCEKLDMHPKSPHKIRKTYGSILLDHHIDNNLIIGQMGHTDVITTERYYHRDRKSMETKEKVINSIPEFLNRRIV